MGMLRTLLALSVVLDHLGGAATDRLVGGRLAVQLFYVISGFLISYVLTATDHYQGAPGRFYANRALRLYPVYLVVAALTLLAYAGAGESPFWRIYDGLPLTATVYLALSNLLILGQDWLMFFGIEHGALAFTGSFAHSDVPLYQGLLVPQAWTLGVELSFYLIAPFVLHSPRRLLLLLLASLALRVALVASGIGRSDPWTYRFFPTELALFLAGSLSHQVLLPRWQAWSARLRRLPELGTALLLLLPFPWHSTPRKRRRRRTRRKIWQQQQRGQVGRPGAHSHLEVRVGQEETYWRTPGLQRARRRRWSGTPPQSSARGQHACTRVWRRRRHEERGHQGRGKRVAEGRRWKKGQHHLRQQGERRRQRGGRPGAHHYRKGIAVGQGDRGIAETWWSAP